MRVISAAFAVSVVAAVGLGVLYWQGGQPQLEGTLLALSAGGIAVGLIMWSHRLLPNDPEVEDRAGVGELAEASGPRSTPTSIEVTCSRRRRVLRRFLVAAVGCDGRGVPVASAFARSAAE